MKIQRITSRLLLMILLISTQKNAISQTVTLGSGTEINGITTSSPINIYFRKTVCQIVYTAAELTAAGAVAGPINELGFYVSNNPIYALPDYEIQIKHTNATNAGGTFTGGFTTVKTIASYSPTAGGWDMLSLDTPFAWNGTQNIVIRICWSQVSPSYDPSGQVRVYNATSGYKYRRSDTGGSACGLTPNTTLNTKPQIRFVFNSETVWTGTASTSWTNSSNWTAGIPNATMDALIPAGTPFSPLLNTAGSCKKLTLVGNLTLGVSGTLTLYNDLINTGHYIDLGGITIFTGVDSHEISTSTELTIENLRSNSSAGLSITSGTVVIGTELQVNKGVFNTNDALVINSDASGTARIDELSTTCTYTLSMTDVWGDGWNGGFLTVFEDDIAIGTFACLGAASTGTFKIKSGSQMALYYTMGSYETENAYTLLNEDGTVIFADGTSPDAGDVYDEIASGCSFSSLLVGNITMERYVDAGETYWRYFASAVEDPTISQYLDDFTTAGFPGSPFPDFPFTSIYSYDETLGPGLGYVPCAGTSEVIEVGKGYQVWSGDTITGTEPFLVDLVGPANQGDIAMPVSYTPSGSPTEDGWCLVGNPYASTIDWDSPNWTKSNMANATYIQNPDNQLYATYVAGAGANGGSRYIASQQSFWVQAVAASPVLTAHENVKSNVDAAFFRTDAVYSPGMLIQLANHELVDEAIVRHIDGAIDAFEPSFDAEKMYGGWGVNPQLTVLNNDNVDLTVHSFDQTGSEFSIPLRVIVFETGIYQLKFSNTAEIDAPCMRIEDTYTGVFYSIEEGVDLDFMLYDTTYAPRFVLHIGRNYSQSSVDVNCNGESDGAFNLDLASDEMHSYELFADGFYVMDSALFNPFFVGDLQSGAYSLVISDFDNLCGLDTFNFNIHQPNQLTISAVLSPELYGVDGAIHVDVEGGTPPYDFSWSTGETVNMIEGVPAGAYELYVNDVNDCNLDTVFNLNSLLSLVDNDAPEAIVWFYDTNRHQINVRGLDLQAGDVLMLYTVNGALVKEISLIESENGNTLQLPLDMPAGIYFIKGAQENTFYRFKY